MAIQFKDAANGQKTRAHDGDAKSKHALRHKGMVEPSTAQRGRPRLEDQGKTIEAQKPWEALGMSRRTWYRRKREARTK